MYSLKEGVSMSQKMKRVNIMIDDETSSRLDELADRLAISRSAVVRVLIRQAFQQEDALKAFNDFNSFAKLLEEYNETTD